MNIWPVRGQTFSTALEYWLSSATLVGIDLEQLTRDRHTYQSQCQGITSPQVLIVTDSPATLIAALITVWEAQGSLFVGNPHWQSQEWQQVFHLIQVDLLWGDLPVSAPSLAVLTPAIAHRLSSYLYLPTGGSSGNIKFAAHTWETLTASIQGMQTYFQEQKIHSFDCLPLGHVSGLMPLLRSWLTGGNFTFWPYQPLKHQPPSQDYSQYFLSLVPTQLQFLLDHFPQWLQQFKVILLGGGPAWPSLLEQARQVSLNLAPTYGMTETASQVATLKPQDFQGDRRGGGQILPQASVQIVNNQGQALANNEVGLIQIQSKSLFWGYYPQIQPRDVFCPGDLGLIDAQGYLQVVGRHSQLIITGGEKVLPAEVEGVIFNSGMVQDVVVLGLGDRRWGEMVVAMYVPSPDFQLTALQDYLKPHLAAYKCPKYWQPMDKIPRSPSGKVNYAQLKTALPQEFNDV